MKRHVLQLMLVLLPLATLANPAEWTRLFEEARVAYDQGDFPLAVERYEVLLDQGRQDPEVLFNLGNALYRQGQAGQAIARYREAQYQRPRDPDIQANLRVVQQQVGARASEPGMHDRVLGQLSRQEWRTLGLACYWVAGLCGAGFLLARRHTWMKHLALLALAGLLLAALGTWYWHQYRRQPEAVVTRTGVQALFAPMPGAMVHFALPEGSRLRVHEQTERWMKIAVGRQEGWIPREACVPLSLPH